MTHVTFAQHTSVFRAIEQWRRDGGDAALATVVHSSSSAPRGLGAQLAITDSGSTWRGGLSGGCAESEVLLAAADLLEHGDPARATLLRLTHDELGSAGPVCGATLTVVVRLVDDALMAELRDMHERPLRGEPALHSWAWTLQPGADPTAQHIELAADRAHQHRRSDADMQAVAWHETATAVTLSIRSDPPRRLIIGGSGDIAAELITLARQLGWRWAVVDPRVAVVRQMLESIDISTASISDAGGTVLHEWPAAAFDHLDVTRNDACLALAHDSKVDVPFLSCALASRASYVGSIGSRLTHHTRDPLLREAVGADLAARHDGPAGLDLGGTGAAEIALSIASGMLAAWNDRSGGRLRGSDQPIRAS